MELAVPDRSVLDKRSNIVPVALIGFPFRIHQAVQLVRHLLGNMRADLFHISVVLQEGPADIQRQVGTVNHAPEQHQEFRNDFLDVVRYKYLPGKQLDLSLMGTEIVLQLREIQDTLQVEGVIHIQVNPEQRIVKVRKYLVVEGLVLLVGAVRRLFQPQRCCIIDLLRLRHLQNLLGFRRPVLVLLIADRNILFHRLRVCVFEYNRVSHISAVAVQYLAHAPGIQEFLFLIGDMQDDVRTVRRPAASGDFIIHAVRGYPGYRLCTFFAGQRLYFHLFADHEHRIEAQAEMPDDITFLLGLVLKLLHEFRGSGECHLVDIPADFIRCHADPGIGNPDGLLFLVHRHSYRHRLLTVRMKHPELGDCVARVRHRLSQKNILIRIQPLLDHRHNILRVDRNGSVFFLNRHFSYLLKKPAALRGSTSFCACVL